MSANLEVLRRTDRIWRLSRSSEAGAGSVLIAMVLSFALIEPTRFASPSNLLNVVTDASPLAILAMATTFVVISRNLDLSIGGIVAFTEVVAAKSMTVDGGPAIAVWGLVVAITAGSVWGAVNGLLVTRARVPSFVATLATLGMAQGAAYVISDGIDVGSVPADLVDAVGVGRILGVPVLVCIAALTFVLTAILLTQTQFGRCTYAIGSDPLAASRAGIDVRAHTLKIYLIAGAMYGLVAWLNLSRFSASNVAGHANDGLNAITAVVLGGASLFGGVGSAVGSLIGVFIPAVLRNGLVIIALQPFWQLIAIGAALAVAVSVDQHRRRKGSIHTDIF